MRWVEERDGIEALFLEEVPGSGFARRLSSGFGRLLDE